MAEMAHEPRHISAAGLEESESKRRIQPRFWRVLLILFCSTCKIQNPPLWCWLENSEGLNSLFFDFEPENGKAAKRDVFNGEKRLSGFLNILADSEFPMYTYFIHIRLTINGGWIARLPAKRLGGSFTSN